MASWTLAPGYEHLAADFGSLDAVFALQGERLTRDPLSEVVRIERDGINYYVKRYTGAGKHMRRYLGRPRIKAEWQNLKQFASEAGSLSQGAAEIEVVTNAKLMPMTPMVIKEVRGANQIPATARLASCR